MKKARRMAGFLLGANAQAATLLAASAYSSIWSKFM
jgi:hypothetical protein